MADAYMMRVAGELADLALADQEASGDINIVDTVAGVLGASSQTLEEAFLTAVRVRRAEARARALLADRKATNYADAPKPAPAPMQGDAAEDEESRDSAITAPESRAPRQIEDHSQDAGPDKPKGVGMPRRIQR